ncbi:MAG: sensor histidine kinase [Deltaproteobacteria bacterium]|nr:sensor histidine kinase [Deltaproteobacteria bacterium]
MAKVQSMHDQEVQIPIFYQRLLDFVRSHRDPQAIESHIRALARAATQTELDYSGPEARTAGHRIYDSLIENIFKSVIRAISRNALLEQTIEALWNQKASNTTICLFVLEALPTSGREDGSDIKALMWRGVNEHLWRNFAEDIRSRLRDSHFLRDLLIKGESFLLWLSSYIPNYLGEFDLLVKASQQGSTESQSYWISAVALRSGQVGRANRALIVLYENRGDELVPKLPPGANQEWRVLQFLGVAYQVLEHQLANVAEEVHGQRQRLLSQLAPGILHHEIGIQTRHISELLAISQKVAERLNDRYKLEDTKRLQENLQVLADAAGRLYHIADAFNNLERRRARETVQLDDLLKEITTLTYHRLGKIGAVLSWSPNPMLQTLETDPALLLHLMLNIIINAINAFEEDKDDKKRDKRMVVILSPKSSSPHLLRLWLFNNGPAISEELLERIFEKGFTTRKGGHGYGLYICRLIAEALGGQIRALPQAEFPAEWSVGFQLELPVVAGRELDLIGERQTSKA